MNRIAEYLHVQVVFAQGKIKSFMAPKEILMDDFMKVVKLHGKVKRLRYQPDCTKEEMESLVFSGNATLIEARRPQHVQI
jgi:hypothetical protein